MMRFFAIAWFVLAITMKAASAQGYNTGLPMPGIPVSLGQKTAAGSTSVVLASNQSAITVTGTISQASNTNGRLVTATVTASESSYAGPTNAVGVLVESDSLNSVSVRYGISNSAVPILNSATGMLLEPGRDSGYLPSGAGSYIHLIGVSAGNEVVGIQWILSQ